MRIATLLQFLATTEEFIGVIPAHDCMDAGVRATQDAKAEAGIHYEQRHTVQWIPAYAGMTKQIF